MRIYKYRDLSIASFEDFQRMRSIIQGREVWCSGPALLNDHEEFQFSCDFTPTESTIHLLANIMTQFRGHTPSQALDIARQTIDLGQLGPIARPIVMAISKQSRDTLGVSCFGMAETNEILWTRYGGDGQGICIEFDMTASLLRDSIYRVDYAKERVLHIDVILESCFDNAAAFKCYKTILLTKTEQWKPEEEIRLISKEPNVSINLSGSRVLRVFLGRKLKPSTVNEIHNIVANSIDHPLIENMT